MRANHLHRVGPNCTILHILCIQESAGYKICSEETTYETLVKNEAKNIPYVHTNPIQRDKTMNGILVYTQEEERWRGGGGRGF